MLDIQEVRVIQLRVKAKLEAKLQISSVGESGNRTTGSGCLSQSVRDRIQQSLCCSPNIDQVVKEAFADQSEIFDRRLREIKSCKINAEKEIKNQIYFMDTRVDKLFSQLL